MADDEATLRRAGAAGVRLVSCDGKVGTGPSGEWECTAADHGRPRAAAWWPGGGANGWCDACFVDEATSGDRVRVRGERWLCTYPYSPYACSDCDALAAARWELEPIRSVADMTVVCGACLVKRLARLRAGPAHPERPEPTRAEVAEAVRLAAAEVERLPR